MQITRKNITRKFLNNRVYRPKGLLHTYQWAESLQNMLRGSELSAAERLIVRRMRDRAEAWGLAEGEHRMYYGLSGMNPRNPEHVMQRCCCGFDRCHGLAAYGNARTALKYYGRNYLKYHAIHGVNSVTRNAAKAILAES